MIILDTNVLSELMRPAPSDRVLAWFQGFTLAELFTTAITESEIRQGLALLPAGRRRASLEAVADGMFADLENRVLPFDSTAAKAFAGLQAARRKAGRAIGRADAEVAAIARSHSARLATRNPGDFAGCGVELIDPWRE